MFDIITVDELIERLGKYDHAELHIHHTYKPDGADWKKRPDGFYWQEVMKRFHMEEKGWSDIGQHVTLLPDGSFVTGRDFAKNPASILGHNDRAFAVEILGNFDEGHDRLEGPQKDSILKLARWFDQRGRYIRFHRENSHKTCPGSSIDKESFLQEVKGGKQVEKDKVMLIQRELESLGYHPGPIDGVWGPKTEKAFLCAMKALRSFKQPDDVQEKLDKVKAYFKLQEELSEMVRGEP